ncbi:MAG: septum formation initiator family protein [Armatimonadetes bacterium]|nr:septum formation initiator family protein [Armatimonadota bacterium]
MRALFVTAALILFLGQQPLQPIWRGWQLTREILDLKAERDRLQRENTLLRQYEAATRTPEGLELLARGRYHMLRKGEWLVVVAEPPPAEIKPPRGLRAVMDKMRAQADDALKTWRSLWETVSAQRRSRPTAE